MKIKKIILGNDHADILFVNAVIAYLKEKNIEVEHIGTFTDESVDYPDFAEKVGKKVVESNSESVKGVVICGTGIGISIAANKVNGVICANCTNPKMAQMSREHNNANVLALGARILSIDEAKKIIDSYLESQFEGGRHQQRVEKIFNLEFCK